MTSPKILYTSTRAANRLISLNPLLIDRLFDWLMSRNDAAGRRKREHDGEFKRLASAPGMAVTNSFFMAFPTGKSYIISSTGVLSQVDNMFYYCDCLDVFVWHFPLRCILPGWAYIACSL